jgi:hypothetical protein
MKRPAIAIKVQAIEGRVLHDPLGHFQHTFVSDDEINCRPKTLTNWFPTGGQFVTCMLIESGCNATRNMLGQLTRAEAIGERDFSEVVDDGIKHEGRQARQRSVGLGLPWNIGNIRLRLCCSTLDEITEAKMPAALLIRGSEWLAALAGRLNN